MNTLNSKEIHPISSTLLVASKVPVDAPYNKELQLSIFQGHPSTVSPLTHLKHFLGYPECFIYLEMHSKGRCRICISSVILGQL